MTALTFDTVKAGDHVRVLWPDMRKGYGRITDVHANGVYIVRIDGRLEWMPYGELNARKTDG